MEEAIALLKELEINRGIALLAVLGFGVFAMVQVFKHMKKGFGEAPWVSRRLFGLSYAATAA